VIKHLRPLIMYSPFCLTALVLIEPASEPAFGSVRQKEASPPETTMSDANFFCSCVPARRTGISARLLDWIVVANPASAFPNSSDISELARAPSPAPPMDSGISRDVYPSSAAFRYRSRGVSPIKSHSFEIGRSFVSANSRAIF